MLDVIGAGTLMGPWLVGWELVVDSPEASMAAIAVLFTMAMSGIALAVFGGRRRQESVQMVAVVVQAPRPTRRMRRR